MGNCVMFTQKFCFEDGNSNTNIKKNIDRNVVRRYYCFL